MQISIVSLSKTKKYKDMRFDAEFYSEELLSVIKKIEKYKYYFVRDFARIKSGVTPRERSEDLKQGTILLKTTNIRDNIIYYTNADDFFFIDEKTNKRMRTTQLIANDVLINIVGATTGVVGRTSIIFDDFPKSNITQAIAFCRVEGSEILPEYLFIFLKGCFGKTQTKYIARPTGQYNLNLQEVGYLRVPLLSKDLQLLVKRFVFQAKELQKKSQFLYTEAQNILLSELNLLNWKPKHRLSFIKNFSDTQSANNRIDAEYFQPMYDEVIEKVKQYKNGWSRLDDQFSQNRKSFHKINDHNYHYVEISCVRTSDGSIEPLVLSGRDLPANAKIKLQKNDIIISKVRPYRGAISIIQTDNLVGSSAFTVVQEKGTLFKETLFVLLRTKAYLKYSLKFNTGTSYPTIDDQDILGFPVPLIANAVQVSIKHKIEEAIRTKHQSQSLLDIAKRGVELAIEENEQSAEKWIKRELDKLGVET